MAGSIADNDALCKKKTFIYGAPIPPAELIKSTKSYINITGGVNTCIK